MNGNKKIEVASKGILVTESLEAYDFVTAMLENGRKKMSKLSVAMAFSKVVSCFNP